MSEWNPDLYLKFEKERTQPVKDLIFRIEKENPKRIIDIGCGPGNSTMELKKRWKDAEIAGIDNSKTMLAKAQNDYPDFKWIQCDAGGDLSSLGKFDIVFSNAVIQWIPDHKGLIKRLFNILNDEGVLAVQLPNTTYMPISIAISKTASEDKWQKYFGKTNNITHKDLSFYYDILSPLGKRIDLWETKYNHIVSGHEAIIEWYRSTGLKPYLEKLNEEEKEEFTNSVLLKIKKEYMIQKDGNILFPFRRLFFIAYK